MEATTIIQIYTVIAIIFSSLFIAWLWESMDRLYMNWRFIVSCLLVGIIWPIILALIISFLIFIWIWVHVRPVPEEKGNNKIKLHSTKEGKLYIKGIDLFSLQSVQDTILEATKLKQDERIK